MVCKLCTSRSQLWRRWGCLESLPESEIAKGGGVEGRSLCLEQLVLKDTTGGLVALGLRISSRGRNAELRTPAAHSRGSKEQWILEALAGFRTSRKLACSFHGDTFTPLWRK